MNFRGNIEARQLPLGGCDVAVTDGFSGNLLLKLYEGMGKFFSGELKTMLTDGFSAKIAAAILLNKIKAFKKRVDYSEYGGAPMLGAAKPVIKAHGSSKEKAFYNAIRQAKQYVENDVGGEISAALEILRTQKAQASAEALAQS